MQILRLLYFSPAQSHKVLAATLWVLPLRVSLLCHTQGTTEKVGVGSDPPTSSFSTHARSSARAHVVGKAPRTYMWGGGGRGRGGCNNDAHAKECVHTRACVPRVMHMILVCVCVCVCVCVAMGVACEDVNFNSACMRACSDCTLLRLS